MQYEGGDVLDASLLMMPLAKFIAPPRPQWLSTLDALTEDLDSDSLVYRYDPQADPRRTRGDEGTFSICSFWYVEALVCGPAGSTRPGGNASRRLLSHANHLGLYAEEIGRTGEQRATLPAGVHPFCPSSAPQFQPGPRPRLNSRRTPGPASDPLTASAQDPRRGAPPTVSVPVP